MGQVTVKCTCSDPCAKQREAFHAGYISRNDEVDRLKAAIEAMRVSGGAAEFQAAFDNAKSLL